MPDGTLGRPQARERRGAGPGGRWSWQRFVELERRIGTITPKVLTQRLRQLERDGLVRRSYHAEIPPRVEYEISHLGRSLAPLFASLAGPGRAGPAGVRRARPAKQQLSFPAGTELVRSGSVLA